MLPDNLLKVVESMRKQFIIHEMNDSECIAVTLTLLSEIIEVVSGNVVNQPELYSMIKEKTGLFCNALENFERHDFFNC